MTNDTTSVPLLTREQLRHRLNECGYPISASYFNKVCLPSVNAGPPVAKQWGKRPLYNLEAGLAWADTTARNTLLTRANQQKLALLFGDRRSQRLISDLEAELHGKRQIENVIGGSQTTPEKERTNAILPAPAEMGYFSNINFTKPASFIPEWMKPQTIMEGAKTSPPAYVVDQNMPKIGMPGLDIFE